MRRAKAAEQDAKNRADAEKKDGKDERMEELLRKVCVWGGSSPVEWRYSNNTFSCDCLSMVAVGFATRMESLSDTKCGCQDIEYF